MAGRPRKSSRFRRIGALVIALGAALVVSGCVSFTYQAGFNHMTFWKRATDQIISTQYGPTCNQDLDRNGHSGDFKDRAWCAFYVIRASYCNNLRGTEHHICYAATELDGRDADGDVLWYEYANTAAERVQSGAQCLSVYFDAFGQIRDWQLRRYGDAGCVE